MFAWARVWAFVAAGVIAGCGSKDASLGVYTRDFALELQKDQPEQPRPFGDGLTGRVQVVFDLGNWSSGPLEVQTITLGFSRGGKVLIERAGQFFSPVGVTLPMQLNPGDERTIAYTIAAETLTKDESAALCAGPVEVTGRVQHAGEAAPVAIGGSTISVTGCTP